MQRSGAVSVSLAALLALAGCSGGGTVAEATRGPAGTVTQPGSVGVSVLQVGDCIDDPSLGASDAAPDVMDLQAVPCGAGHTAEVVAVDNMFFADAAGYPGDVQVAQQASDACEQRLEEYTATPSRSGTFDAIALYPTQQSWSQADDRGVACLGVTLSEATGEAVSTTGSIKAR